MVFIRNRHLVNPAMDRTCVAVAFAISGLWLGGPAYGANSSTGQGLGAGAPIANSTVTLWATAAGDPRQLAQPRAGADGRFSLDVPTPTGSDSSLYLIAKGGQPSVSKASADNPAIALLAVVGTTNPPTKVAINEFTTVASVWTHNQFVDGTAIKGHALGLKIAVGNVPSFVDIQSGGWGTTIQDPLNSGQTPTMANFATLADVLAACVTRVTADACDKLFSAATPPKGSAPTDTLTAAESVVRYP